MDINQSGEIISHRIEESVINVDRRMSYTSVNKIIGLEDKEEQEKYKEFIPMFALMYEAAAILRKRRFKRGSIDFDFPESKIILDEKGKPLEIKEYERNNAHRIIEEFMLAANQTVAEEYFWQELPFVYRVHDTPDSEKILQLSILVNNFGYILKTGANDEIHPKEIQKLLNNVKGKPEEALISKLALRSMRQAKYATNCGGHFGLAMKYYCHFTSPIRRYPDLQIHRIIKENIHGKLEGGRISHYNKILPEVAEASSMLERRADDSEREVEKLKKAEYMEQFIGQSFEGMVSGVTSWGMYVELPNTVEGMVKVADIPGDYYYFDEEHYSMTGEHTGKTYKLGDKIKVTVAAVDRIIKTIDFVIAEEEEEVREKVQEDKKKTRKVRKADKKKDSNTDGMSSKELKYKEVNNKEIKNKEAKNKRVKNKETAKPEAKLKTKETAPYRDVEMNQVKKENRLATSFVTGKARKVKKVPGKRKKKKQEKGLKRIFVSPLDKQMKKLIRKKPVIDITAAAPKQAVRINTGSIIKDVARVGINKGRNRRPAKAAGLKKNIKTAGRRAGRKSLHSIRKHAVAKKVLSNRRRIITAKKRKSSNNN